MECCVKAGDLGNARSRVKNRAYGSEIVRLVQWRQRFEPCKSSDHITIQTDGGVEFHAAMDDAVSDAFDRGSGNQTCRRGDYFPCGSVMVEPVSGPGALNPCATLGVLNLETWANANALDLTVE